MFYLFDVVFRSLYLTMFKNPRQCLAEKLPGNVVRLTFEREALKYSAGQYVYLMVPKLSVFEWHPFSLSTAPHQDKVVTYDGRLETFG